MTHWRRVWGYVAALAVMALAQAAGADLDGALRQRIHAAGLGNAQVSVLAIDLSTDQVLAALHPDEPLIPASNMKLLTTAAALRVLGPDYVFQTELRLIEPGEWRAPAPGSAAPVPPGAPAGGAAGAAAPASGPVLLVRGDGDPGFGDPELLRLHGLDLEGLLDMWVSAVRDAGIARVERLIIDDRVFDRQFVHPTWPEDQLNHWYCAQVAGVNFNDNCLDLLPEPTQPGQPPRVRLIPEMPFLATTNRALTAAGDTFWASRKPGTNELTFYGKVQTRRTTPINVTVHDPPGLFGRLLAHRLAAAGIAVGEVVVPQMEDRLPAGRPLHTVQTTLPLVLQRCNKDSQNLFAEALLKRMGRHVTGAPGSWDNGASAVRMYLSAEIGAAAAAVSVADGSGMSRDNRVSARLLVNILAAMHRDPQLGPIYRDSLSVGGADGTLQRRFREGVGGTVHAKSGYINGVSSLSGYLVSEHDGRERVIAFSCLVNGFKAPVALPTVRTLQDQIVQSLDRKLAATPTPAPRP